MNGHEICETLLKAYQELFPEIDLTFGYIGNCERWGDDRSWYFFTQVRDHKGRRMTFGGGVRTDGLYEFSMRAALDLGIFCQRAQAFCEKFEVAEEHCMSKNGCTFCDYCDYDEGRGHCHTLS